MMLSVLFVGIALLGACESRPGVHRFTSETITRIHKIPGGGEVIHYKTKYGGGNGGVAVNGGVNKHIKVDKNDGNSYFNTDTGVNRRTRCNRGLIDETATGVKNVGSNILSGAAGAINTLTGDGTVLGPIGGAVNAVGEGAKELGQNVLSGANNMVQDAACGLGNIANAAAEALETGDILGGVGTIGQEFFGGLGNMAEDAGSGVAGALGGAASKVFGFLGDLGK